MVKIENDIFEYNGMLQKLFLWRGLPQKTLLVSVDAIVGLDLLANILAMLPVRSW